MSRPPGACITPRRAGGGAVPGEGRAGLSAAAACPRKRRGTVTAERDPLRRCIGGGVRRHLYRYWSAEVPRSTSPRGPNPTNLSDQRGNIRETLGFWLCAHAQARALSRGNGRG